jgi:tRNA-splicing ligase RtcB
MQDGNGSYWVTAHFGSRGLGHSIASGFMKLAKGLKWDDKLNETDEPLLLEIDSDLGHAYIACMDLAASYARLGREAVTESVLDILSARATSTVDNHHNFSFEERYGKGYLHVARKGSTPISPLTRGVVGGSMCDNTVILSGREEDRNKLGLTDTISSTVHGAGRVMSRMEAKGKRKWKTGELVLDADGNPKRPGKVTPEMMFNAVREADVTLRGGDLDESPFVYRKLKDVLVDCPNVNIEAVLTPKIVLMAPSSVVDPYKD